MFIFNKELNLKNYDCKKENQDYRVCQPKINLYLQTTPRCNGSCSFCDLRNHSKIFNFDKLKEIVKIMDDNNILGKIAISGGEPLLEIDRTIQIANTFQNYYVTLNTNGSLLKELKEVYPLIKEIDISKHHFKNSINDNILKLKTYSLEDLYLNNLNEKININCVFQKNGLKTKEDLIQMLEVMSKYNFKHLKAISLLPLTKRAKDNFINLNLMMDEFKTYLNNGILYDKDMCKCFEFLYVANNGNIIKTTMRHTFDDNYSCIKQFVYDGEYLYDGFKKNNIIF